MAPTECLCASTTLKSSSDDVASADGPLLLCAEIAKLLSESIDAGSILNRFVDAVTMHLSTASSCCWLFDRSRGLLNPAARTGRALPFDGLNQPVPINKTAIGEVAGRRTPLIVNDLRDSSDPEVSRWAAREGILAFACLPIETTAHLHGVIAAFRETPFSDRELFALNTAQRQVAYEMERSIDAAAMHGSHALIQSVVRSAPVAVIGIDRNRNVTFWNQEAEHSFGWLGADVIGRQYTILPAEGREQFDDHLREVLAGRRLKRLETTRQRADGRVVPVLAALSPTYDQQGSVVGAVEVLVDETRQKQAERCLRTQLTISNLLAEIDAIEDVVPAVLRAVCEQLGWVCGELWLRGTNANELSRIAFQALPGFRVDRLQSTIPQNETHPGQGIVGRIIAAENGIWHADLTGIADATRAQLAQRDGLFAAIGSPIVRDHVVIGALCFFADSIPEPDRNLTELLSSIAGLLEQYLERRETKAALQVAQDNLQQTQKMDAIGLLAGGVAHDFNNILSVILAHSEIGLDELTEEHPLKESFQEINNAGHRAAALTRQLLAFSRKQVFQPTDVDLNRLADGMDRMLRRLIGPAITYETRLSQPLHLVRADAAQLEQVLLNLVVNARDAMPNGGSIRVGTQNVELDERSLPRGVQMTAGTYVLLTVSDTGCGMDESTMTRIFEPFFTTKEPGKGTGMGLSTVYGIVQKCGGCVSVDSRLGEGTTFSIYLPKARQQLATQQIDAPLNELPIGSGTIMIVDSDDTLRSVVHRLLKVRGYDVVEAQHGAEALDILAQSATSVDLVLTDILMPVMDGIALAKRIRREFPEVKVVFMSGSAEVPTDGEDPFVSEEHYLQKPFTSESLLRKVHNVLAGAGSNGSN